MKLKYLVALSLPFALGVAVGCDDDRTLGDLGPGQQFGGSGSQAGETATSGGSDAAGQGGAGAGGQGAGGAAECPLDFVEADGTPCSVEGQICSDGADDPCGFGNSLLCFDGEWQRQEAFPAPCGGAGAGGAEVGGAGGAGGGAGGAEVGGAGGAG